MYDLNHMNALYFYPHKLHFSPIPDATDSEQRNRWFPGYDVSVVSSRTKASIARDAGAPGGEPPGSDRDRCDADDARMDDDGGPAR
jgi:hypothetical protein